MAEWRRSAAGRGADGPVGGVARRGLLLWGAALPGLPVLAERAAVPDEDLQRLRERSARLTGFDAVALDEGFAAGLWAAFAEAGRLAELRSWLAEPEPAPASGPPAEEGASSLAVEVAAAWYSGTLPWPTGAAVGTYYGALAWQAVAFANPGGRCNAPGHWADAPVEKRARQEAR